MDSPVYVSPVSKIQLERITSEYLKKTIPSHLERPGMLDVEELVDLHLLKTHGFSIEICSSLGENVEAQTCPIGKVIKMTNQVYTGICNGNPRDKSTGCHEVVHVIRHAPQIVDSIVHEKFPRSFYSPQELPVYYSPEWQAYYGAGAFLMPKITLGPFIERLLRKGAKRCQVIEDVLGVYGVSYSAAEKRLSYFKM